MNLFRSAFVKRAIAFGQFVQPTTASSRDRKKPGVTKRPQTYFLFSKSKPMRALVTLMLCLCIARFAQAQCELLDGNGNMEANPVWVSCSGGAYTLFLQSNTTFGPYSIDWGDGSPPTTGASLVPPTFVSHNYAAAIANYTVTFTELGTGCVVTGMVVMEEPVNASIQIPIGGVTQICAPGDILFTNSSTDVSSNTVFTWDFGDGTPPLIFGDTNLGQTISHTYQRNTVNCVTAVTLTAENFCSFGNPTIATFNPVQIYDLDDAAITASANLLCYPDTVVHFDNTTARNCVPEGNVAQRYEYWNFGDYWGLGYDSIINWQPFAPPNRPGYDIAFPGIGTYTIMMIDSNQCGRDTAFSTIQIVDQPTAAFTANRDTICAGEQITFTNNSFGGANAFQWNFGNNNNFQNTGGGPRTRTFNNPGIFTITLVANINGGTATCTDTARMDVVVLASPNANFTLSNNNGCDTMDVTFTDGTTGGAVSWLWDFDNGNTDTTQTPPTQTYTVGTYNVSLTVSSANGCTNTETEVVRVFQSPVPAFTPTNVCEDVLSTFLDGSTSQAGDPILTWAWNFGDGNTSSAQNPTQTYADSGTFNVVLQVNTANCFGVDTVPVAVEPKPTAGFTKDTLSGCSPLVVNFTNTSVGAANYTWDFGDGNTSTAQDPSHTYTNNSGQDTVFTIRLISETAFGCADTTEQTVTIFFNPNAAFSVSSTSGCGPFTTQFTNNSSGVASFAWDFGDTTGSSLANPSHTYTNTTLFNTNYTANLVVVGTNGCTDTASQNIQVFPTPIFDFTTIPDSGCSPLNVSFISSTATVAVVFDWDFGDGNSANGVNPSNVFVNNTTNNQIFNVELVTTSSSGCTDTTYTDVKVFPNPDAVFTAVPDTACHPAVITFNNTSTGAISFDWDFDDGDTSDTGVSVFTHTYFNTGIVPVVRNAQLVVATADGCRDTANQNVTVNPLIDAVFTSDTVGCHPFTVAFTDNSVGVDNYFWDFGDGNTSTMAAPTHVFQNLGQADSIYTVKLVTTSIYGCADSQMVDIRVHPKPVASFTPSDTVGCQPLSINFANSSIGGNFFRWDFGDGDTSNLGGAVVPHVYNNTSSTPNSLIASLLVTNNDGCRDTADTNILVYPEIVAAYSSDSVGCQPYPLSFTNLSTGASVYAWDFGDGDTTSQVSPNHLYQNPGTINQTFTSQLIATSIYNCSDTATRPILVYPKPVADFSVPDTIGCQPLQLAFQNNSVIADTYIWAWGDNDTSNAGTPIVSHTYTNLDTATRINPMNLIVLTNNGCSDTASQDIYVYPQIVAAYASDSVGCSPYTLPFTNQSIGASVYAWNFGDNNSSTQVSPTHTYQNSTTGNVVYSASMVATSQFGCADTTFKPILIYPKPVAAFVPSDTIGCQPLEVMFTNNSVIADSYIWDFGDGDSSTLGTPTVSHTYTNLGVNTTINPMLLIVSTNNGCSDTLNQDIYVYPQVIADFSSDTVGCSPYALPFTNNSTGAATYAWDFGDLSAVSSAVDPSHVFANPTLADTLYTVTLIATSADNCPDTATQVIRVHPKPIADFNLNPTSICEGTPTTFTNNSVLNQTNFWDIGNNGLLDTIATLSFDSVFFNSGTLPQTELITLIVQSADGCLDTTQQSLQVFPRIEADFSVADSACSPVDGNIVNTSIGSAAYIWSFGDGSANSNLQQPTHTFSNPSINDTTYTMRLIVQSIYGCADTAFQNVTVFSQPTASFTATPANQVFPLATVNVNNTSSPGNWSYNWDWGDTTVTTLENPGPHTYNTWGNFNISLIVSSNFCSDTAINQIVIEPPLPIADFTGQGTGCKPLTVTFSNISQYGVTYEWDFGDGGKSTLENPPPYTYFNAGTYTVSLRVVGPGGDVDIEVKQNIVVVNETPIAFFDLNPKTVVVPTQAVQFFNFSNFADSYVWDFGDGNFSTAPFPSHNYTEEGAYTVTLFVANNFGCRDTFVLPTEVIAESRGEVQFPNAFTPNSAGPTGGIYDPNSINNEVFFPVSDGVLGYHLMIFNRWGELLFESKDVNIGWDGYYRGQLCQQDVYVWKVVAQLSNGNELVKVGDVTLLR